MCIILILESNCSAQRISVCDFTSDAFCEAYNNIVKVLPDKSSILIDKASLKKKYLNNIGTLYFYSLKNTVNGNGTHIILLMNQTNNIFEINITNNMHATKDDTIYAYIAVLKTLGVRDDDIEFFSHLSEPKYKSISPKRTLVTAFRPAGPNMHVDEFKIAAFDN